MSEIEHLDFAVTMPCEVRSHTGEATGRWAVHLICPKCQARAFMIVCDPCKVRLASARAVHEACHTTMRWLKQVKDVIAL